MDVVGRVTISGMLKARLVLSLVLVVSVLAGGSAIFIARAVGHSDGTVVVLSDRLAGPELAISEVLDPASSLRRGDVVRAIDGQRVDHVTRIADPRAGDALIYTVERAGVTTRVPVRLAESWPTSAWALRNWPALLLAASLLGMAVQVFRRRPHDPAAVALLWIAGLGGVGVPAFGLGGQAVDLAYGRDLGWLAFGEGCLALMWGAWLLFVLVFPDPFRGVSVRRLVVVCGALLVSVYGVYLIIVLPGAPSLAVAQWRLIEMTFASGYVLPALIVVVITARFLGARGTAARLYLGWLAAGFAACGLGYYLVWQLPVMIRGAPLLGWNFVPLPFLGCVGTLAAAVLRFGLFDIKAVARRAVVYAMLTVAVVVVYASIVAAAGSLVTTGPLLAPSLVATVVIAVLFQPLKDRVQRSVTRLLYGTRDEPYVALSRLGERLENSAAGDAVLASVTSTVASALKVPYVVAELCAADGGVLRRSESGQPTSTGSVTFPAVSGGTLVGRLLVTPRRAEPGFAPSELRLLTDLVRQAAPALQALQLTVELRESRWRLVRAGAEERRRIQRDLHDGVGPSLAGLRMQIGAARALLAQGATPQASATLAEIERQLVQCVAEVRQLLVALRSPLLDSLGLVGALRYQAQRLGVNGSLVIVVDAPDDLPRLPAAVEEATLAIVSEAMTNAARHAVARRCVVTIACHDGLEVLVTDDGRGIADQPRTGIGLRSMRQRADEIGGTCEVRSAPGTGTRVRATFPAVVSP
jgi:two-component system NarL family sensor kinase